MCKKTIRCKKKKREKNSVFYIANVNTKYSPLFKIHVCVTIYSLDDLNYKHECVLR